MILAVRAKKERTLDLMCLTINGSYVFNDASIIYSSLLEKFDILSDRDRLYTERLREVGGTLSVMVMSLLYLFKYRGHYNEPQ